MGKSLCEGYEFASARLRNLVLHDLQRLGSLTKIWRSLSDTWDTENSALGALTGLGREQAVY
jgi:hypothetical protein